MKRYGNTKIQKSKLKKTKDEFHYSSTVYGAIPETDDDIWVITQIGDRLDSLAYQFYGDVTLWWLIPSANPNIVNFSSIFIPIGSQIRIPQNISSIIDSYNALNR